MWTKMREVRYEAPLWQVVLGKVLDKEALDDTVDMVLLGYLDEIDREPVLGWAPYTHIVTLQVWEGDETYRYLVAIEDGNAQSKGEA